MRRACPEKLPDSSARVVTYRESNELAGIIEVQAYLTVNYWRLGMAQKSRAALLQALQIAREFEAVPRVAHVFLSAGLLAEGRAEDAATWVGWVWQAGKLEQKNRALLAALEANLEAALGEELYAAAVERGKNLDADALRNQILEMLN